MATHAEMSSELSATSSPESAAPVTAPSASFPAPTQKPRAPPGYRLVKVPNPDGSVKTVKKKLSSEELAKPAYEVITVRKPDGTLAKVRRPIKTTVEVPGSGATVDKNARASQPPTELSKSATVVQENRVKSEAKPTPKAEAKPEAKLEADVDAKAKAEPKAGSEANLKTEAKPKDAQTSKPGPGVTSTVDTITAAPVTEGTSYEEALRAQDAHHRATRQHRFKNALFSGMARRLATTVIPDIMDGDEIIHDDDMSMDGDSDFDYDSDDDHHGDEGRDGDAHNSHDGQRGDQQHHESFAGTAASNVAMTVAANGLPPPRPPPPTYTSAATAGQTPDAKEKVTYKVTEKDLEAMDEKAAREANEKTLKRHWYTFSFYLLASLSVVLPLAFFALTIVISQMDGKSINSRWWKVKDAITVAISVWPIVFAAVVAQAFKTWATFRVERGIKLMELEQLMSSNSFASVMKQPIVLRSLNLMTLAIFLIWSLSPIGSQALQRVFRFEDGAQHDEPDVFVARTTGDNLLFSPSTWEMNDGRRSQLLQIASVSFMASYMPAGIEKLNTYKEGQDRYGHPQIYATTPVPSEEQELALETPLYVSSYGIPIVLPIPTTLPHETKQVTGIGTASENYTFNTISSAWEFKCNPWKNNTYASLEKDLDMSFSGSQTLGLSFSTLGNASTINHMAFATLIDGNTSTSLPADNSPNGNTQEDTSSWVYGFIECDFHQVFYNSSVFCTVDFTANSAGEPYCSVGVYNQVADNIPKSWLTDLTDFSRDFVDFGTSYTWSNTTTEFEAVAMDANPMGNTMFRPNSSWLSNDATPEFFAVGFGNLFNTWVTIGYCPGCISLFNITSPDFVALNKTFYDPIKTQHDWSSGPEFQTVKIWLVVLYLCTGGLLAVGTASILIESRIVAPDVLGYVSTTVRNSRYLQLPKTKSGANTTSGAMSGSERARRLRSLEVMMQDVKPKEEVGKIVLGLKTDKAERLQPGKLYR